MSRATSDRWVELPADSLYSDCIILQTDNPETRDHTRSAARPRATGSEFPVRSRIWPDLPSAHDFADGQAHSGQDRGAEDDDEPWPEMPRLGATQCRPGIGYPSSSVRIAARTASTMQRRPQRVQSLGPDQRVHVARRWLARSPVGRQTRPGESAYRNRRSRPARERRPRQIRFASPRGASCCSVSPGPIVSAATPPGCPTLACTGTSLSAGQCHRALWRSLREDSPQRGRTDRARRGSRRAHCQVDGLSGRARRRLRHRRPVLGRQGRVRSSRCLEPSGRRSRAPNHRAATGRRKGGLPAPPTVGGYSATRCDRRREVTREHRAGGP